MFFDAHSDIWTDVTIRRLAGEKNVFARCHLPRLRQAYAGLTPAKRTALCCALGLTVLIFGMYGLGFEAGDFIYSRF